MPEHREACNTNGLDQEMVVAPHRLNEVSYSSIGSSLLYFNGINVRPTETHSRKRAQEEITDWLIHRELLNITNHIPDTTSLLHWLITTFPDMSSIQRDEIMRWQKALAPSKKIKFKGNAVKLPNNRYKTCISYWRYKTPKRRREHRKQPSTYSFPMSSVVCG